MKTKTTLPPLLIAAVMLTPICSAENSQALSQSFGQKTGFQAGYDDGYKVGHIGRELPTKADRIGMGRRSALRNDIPRQYHPGWVYAYVDGFFQGWVAGEVDGRNEGEGRTYNKLNNSRGSDRPVGFYHWPSGVP